MTSASGVWMFGQFRDKRVNPTVRDLKFRVMSGNPRLRRVRG